MELEKNNWFDDGMCSNLRHNRLALAEEKQDDKASAVETVRTYEGDEGDMTLRINVPQVVGKEGYVAEINDKILDLTTDYEARADWEVAQYKDAFLATGRHGKRICG